jgi:hypothetical protein
MQSRREAEICDLTLAITLPLSGAASPSIARAGIRSGGRDILRVLNAKRGFTFDYLQTVVKGRKSAIGGAASKIRAPLTVSLIALRLCVVSKCTPNNKDRDRY